MGEEELVGGEKLVGGGSSLLRRKSQLVRCLLCSC